MSGLTDVSFQDWPNSMIGVFKTAQLWRVVTGDYAQPDETKHTSTSATTEASFLAACETYGILRPPKPACACLMPAVSWEG